MSNRPFPALLLLLLFSRTMYAVDVFPLTNITQDTTRDQEPVVITKVVQGVDQTVAVFMQFKPESTSNPTLWVTREGPALTPSQGPCSSTITPISPNGPTLLPVPLNMNLAGDPAIAGSTLNWAPYVDRIYIVGATYMKSGDPAGQRATSISLWYTDDGGQKYCGPIRVAPSSWGTEYQSEALYDKPSVTISKHYATAGYVYVAAIRLSMDGWPNDYILVARSSDGGATWPQASIIPVQHLSHSPQIAVDPYTGLVYLAYLRYGKVVPDATPPILYPHGKLIVRISSDGGITFGAENWIDAGLLLGPSPESTNDQICSVNIADPRYCAGGASIAARSMLSAKFNDYYDAGLGLTWHARERDPGPNDPLLQPMPVDVKFTTYPYLRRLNGFGPVVTVGHHTAGFQWSPAVDFETGPYVPNWVISYYSDIESKLNFRPILTRLNLAHGMTDSVDRCVTGGYAAGCTDAPSSDVNTNLPIGEYQGLAVSYTFPVNYYTSIFTRVVNGQEDIWWVRKRTDL